MKTEYIEKESAITVVGEAIADGRSWFDALCDFPPADVRPVVRGRWIQVTNGRGGHECDQCHEYAPSYQSGSEYLSNFCPYCGSYNGGDSE